MSLQTNFVKCSMTFHIERKIVKLFKMISRLAQISFIKAEAILLPSDKQHHFLMETWYGSKCDPETLFFQAYHVI